MERLYSDDQEAMFVEAQVLTSYNPILPIYKSRLSGHLSLQEEAWTSQEEDLEANRRLWNLLFVSAQSHDERYVVTPVIVLMAFNISNILGLECGHLYCTSCWTEYLTTKIMDEGASQMIECPGNCKIVVNDQTVMSLITDPRVKLKYQHLITNSFVQCNRSPEIRNGWHNGVSELDNHSSLARLLRWCPSPDCSNAVKVRKWKQRMAKIKFNVDFLLVNYSKPDSKSRRKLFLFKVQHVEARPVKCACGHTFCFSCRLSLMHSPPSRLSLILIFSAPSQQAMT